MVKEQFEAKHEQEECANEPRAQELKLMRDRFEQDRLYRIAQREEDRRVHEARREQDRKNLELISSIINKLN